MRNLVRKYIAPVIFTAGLAFGNNAYSSEIAEPNQTQSQLERTAELQTGASMLLSLSWGLLLGYCLGRLHGESSYLKRRQNQQEER